MISVEVSILQGFARDAKGVFAGGMLLAYGRLAEPLVRGEVAASPRVRSHDERGATAVLLARESRGRRPKAQVYS
jgi:hypothetical protein